MEKIKLNLFVTQFITLKGKMHRYSLSDMAYGEWLVYKDGCPKYYFSIWDDKDSITIPKGFSNMEEYIEFRLKSVDSKLTLKQNLWGLPTSKPYTEMVELEKLPTKLVIPEK